MVIRVKGVKRVVAKGRVYYYHRKTGERIKAEFGTVAFLQEVERLDGMRPPADEKPGTLGALIAAYKASPEFTDLAERTRKDYNRVFDYLAPWRDLPLARLTPPLVFGLRDKAYRKHKRRFANYVIAVLRLTLAWGKPRGWVKSNAAEDVPNIRRPRGGRVVNRAWAYEEFQTVLDAAPFELKVPIVIGWNTGLREGDVLRMTWRSYNGLEIETRQAKTDEPIWVPATAELRAILDEAKATMKDRKVKSTTIVVGKRGRQFTENGFRARFFKLIRRLVDEGKVQPGLTFHGLRHSVGKALADAGCDTRTIMAVTGHQTEAMAAQYTKEADRRRLARSGIVKLERLRTKKRKTLADKMENRPKAASVSD